MTDSLTQREREVLRLQRDGLLQREIAGRLFVTRKTVEAHLANAKAKGAYVGRHCPGCRCEAL